MTRFLTLITLMVATPALAIQPSDWRPTHTIFCSDGIFDRDSGQSLYDFVILERGENDFIVSYLGISHPSFEERPYNHLWLKMAGRFSASLQRTGKVKTYRLKLQLDNEPARIGELAIQANGKYRFKVTPPLARETTNAGLCWDSLEGE
jgi:hypothetical protein